MSLVDDILIQHPPVAEDEVTARKSLRDIVREDPDAAERVGSANLGRIVSDARARNFADENLDFLKGSGVLLGVEDGNYLIREPGAAETRLLTPAQMQERLQDDPRFQLGQGSVGGALRAGGAQALAGLTEAATGAQALGQGLLAGGGAMLPGGQSPTEAAAEQFRRVTERGAGVGDVRLQAEDVAAQPLSTLGSGVRTTTRTVGEALGPGQAVGKVSRKVGQRAANTIARTLRAAPDARGAAVLRVLRPGAVTTTRGQRAASTAAARSRQVEELGNLVERTTGAAGVGAGIEAMHFPESVTQNIDAGMDVDEAMWEAAIASGRNTAVTAWFSAIGIGGVDDFLSSGVGRATANGFLKRYAQAVTQNALSEVPEELTQTLLENTSAVLGENPGMGIPEAMGVAFTDERFDHSYKLATIASIGTGAAVGVGQAVAGAPAAEAPAQPDAQHQDTADAQPQGEQLTPDQQYNQYAREQGLDEIVVQDLDGGPSSSQAQEAGFVPDPFVSTPDAQPAQAPEGDVAVDAPESVKGARRTTIVEELTPEETAERMDQVEGFVTQDPQMPDNATVTRGEYGVQVTVPNEAGGGNSVVHAPASANEMARFASSSDANARAFYVSAQHAGGIKHSKSGLDHKKGEDVTEEQWMAMSPDERAELITANRLSERGATVFVQAEDGSSAAVVYYSPNADMDTFLEENNHAVVAGGILTPEQTATLAAAVDRAMDVGLIPDTRGANGPVSALGAEAINSEAFVEGAHQLLKKLFDPATRGEANKQLAGTTQEAGLLRSMLSAILRLFKRTKAASEAFSKADQDRLNQLRKDFESGEVRKQAPSQTPKRARKEGADPIARGRAEAAAVRDKAQTKEAAGQAAADVDAQAREAAAATEDQRAEIKRQADEVTDLIEDLEGTIDTIDGAIAKVDAEIAQARADGLTEAASQLDAQKARIKASKVEVQGQVKSAKRVLARTKREGTSVADAGKQLAKQLAAIKSQIKTAEKAGSVDAEAIAKEAEAVVEARQAEQEAAGVVARQEAARAPTDAPVRARRAAGEAADVARAAPAAVGKAQKAADAEQARMDEQAIVESRAKEEVAAAEQAVAAAKTARQRTNAEIVAEQKKLAEARAVLATSVQGWNVAIAENKVQMALVDPDEDADARSDLAFEIKQYELAREKDKARLKQVEEQIAEATSRLSKNLQADKSAAAVLAQFKKDVAAIVQKAKEDPGQAQADLDGEAPPAFFSVRRDPASPDVGVIEAGTPMYHGAPGAAAKTIAAMRALLRRPPMKVNGGTTTEGGLVWFSPTAELARHFGETGDPIARSDAPDAGAQGAVFSWTTPRDLRLIDRSHELTAEEARIVDEALGTPDYKATQEGDRLGGVVDFRLAGNYNSMDVDSYTVKDLKGRDNTMYSPWPKVLRALGFDGLLYGDNQVAVATDSDIAIDEDADAFFQVRREEPLLTGTPAQQQRQIQRGVELDDDGEPVSPRVRQNLATRGGTETARRLATKFDERTPTHDVDVARAQKADLGEVRARADRVRQNPGRFIAAQEKKLREGKLLEAVEREVIEMLITDRTTEIEKALARGESASQASVMLARLFALSRNSGTALGAALASLRGVNTPEARRAQFYDAAMAPTGRAMRQVIDLEAKALIAEASGNKAEALRLREQANALRIEGAETRMQEVRDGLAKRGFSQTQIDDAIDLGDPEVFFQLMREVRLATQGVRLGNAMTAYYVQNLFSPATVGANVSGNALMATAAGGEALMASAVNSALHSLSGGKLGKGSRLSDTLPVARTIVRSLLPALRDAFVGAAIGYSQVDMRLGKLDETITEQLGGTAAVFFGPSKASRVVSAAITPLMRAISFVDEFFKALTYRANLAAQAMQIARAEGLVPGTEPFSTRVEELTAAPTVAMQDAALQYSNEMTFKERLEQGSFTGDLVKLNNVLRSKKLFEDTPLEIQPMIAAVPFLSAIARLTRQAARRTVGLSELALMKDLYQYWRAGDAQLKLEKKAAAYKQVYRNATAWLLFTAAMGLGGEDDDGIVGTPLNGKYFSAEQRLDLYRGAGGTLRGIDMSRMDPVMRSFIMAANVRDALFGMDAEEGREAGDRAGRLAKKLLSTYAGQPFLDSLRETLFAAGSGDFEQAGRALSRTGERGLTPFGGTMEHFRLNFAGGPRLRGGTDERNVGVFGGDRRVLDPTLGHYLASMFGLTKRGEQTPERRGYYDAISHLQKVAAKSDKALRDHLPGRPKSSFKSSYTKEVLELSEEEYTRFLDYLGQQSLAGIRQAGSPQALQNVSDPQQAAALLKYLDEVRSKSSGHWRKAFAYARATGGSTP